MNKKKIIVLLGHPNQESFSSALTNAYIEGAKSAGASVRIHDISKMDFDPNLKLGYQAIQDLEPDLKRFQEDLVWAEHFVLGFPMWWGGMPAMVQGLFDRALLPGFAFKFVEGEMLQKKLLTGRSARALITMDTPSWWYRFVLGRPLTLRLRRQILKFCGFKPAKIKLYAGVGHSKPEQRAKWLSDAKALGKQMA